MSDQDPDSPATSGGDAPDLVEAVLASTRDWLARFSYVEARPVELRLLPDALITGRRYPAEGEMLGAVYAGDGRLLMSSIRVSPGAVVPVDPEMAPEVPAGIRRIPRAIYGGMLFLILGHFLFETAARLWLQVDTLARHRGPDGRLPIVFHPSPGFDLEVFMRSAFLRRSMEVFGIRRRDIVMAESDLRVDRLYYPDALSVYHEYLHPMMARVFVHLGEGLARPGWLPKRSALPKGPQERVFLSRRRWPPNTRITNESDLEILFRERGFAVVHPERLAPDELLRVLREARWLAASDGSHAHLAVFCRPGTRMLVLDTRPVPTQFALETMMDIVSVHIPLHDLEHGLWDPQTRHAEPERLGPLVDMLMSRHDP